MEHNAKVYADAEGYISHLQQQLTDAEVKMNQLVAEGETVKEEFAHSRKQHEHIGVQNRQLQQQNMEQESKIEALRLGLEEVTAKYQSYLREVSEFSVWVNKQNMNCVMNICFEIKSSRPGRSCCVCLMYSIAIAHG